MIGANFLKVGFLGRSLGVILTFGLAIFLAGHIETLIDRCLPFLGGQPWLAFSLTVIGILVLAALSWRELTRSGQGVESEHEIATKNLSTPGATEDLPPPVSTTPSRDTASRDPQSKDTPSASGRPGSKRAKKPKSKRAHRKPKPDKIETAKKSLRKRGGGR